MFIGREKELVLLQQDYIGKAVMVYGKRRVGKTTLIQKALDAIYEAKYYAQPMTLDEIHREAQQVANIKELAVKQLGFIAINGFVEQEKPYTYLDGNDIFAGM